MTYSDEDRRFAHMMATEFIKEADELIDACMDILNEPSGLLRDSDPQVRLATARKLLELVGTRISGGVPLSREAAMILLARAVDRLAQVPRHQGKPADQEAA